MNPNPARTTALMIAGLVVLLAAPLAVLAIWAQMVLLEPGEFADLADRTLQEEEVEAALTSRIHARLVEASPYLDTPGVNAALEVAVSRILEQPAFRAVFRIAVESLHEDLTNGDGDLELEVVAAITEMLRRELGEPLASYVPEPAEVQPVVVAASEDYRTLRTAARTADRTSIAVLIAAAAGAAGVFLFARSRAHAGLYVGAAGAGGAVLVIGAVFLLPSIASPWLYEPRLSIYSVFAQSVGTTAAVAAAVSAVVALGAGLLALVTADRRRRW